MYRSLYISKSTYIFCSPNFLFAKKRIQKTMFRNVFEYIQNWSISLEKLDIHDCPSSTDDPLRPRGVCRMESSFSMLCSIQFRAALTNVLRTRGSSRLRRDCAVGYRLPAILSIRLMGESVSRLLGREIIFKESRDRLASTTIAKSFENGILHGINKEPPFTNVSPYLRPRFEIDFPFD